MEITKKAKEELERRVQQLESLIEERGIGSSYLVRAKRVQRDVNLAIIVGGIITFAGLAIWAINKSTDDEE